MEPDSTTMFTPGTSVIYTRLHWQPIARMHDFSYCYTTCFHLSLCFDLDKLCTPTFLVLCHFVFCRNFCAPQCACTVVVPFPGGWGGGASLGHRPPGAGGGPSSLGGGRTWGIEGKADSHNQQRTQSTPIASPAQATAQVARQHRETRTPRTRTRTHTQEARHESEDP